MKKYELTKEIKEIQTESGIVTLHRIRAVRDFGNVKAGDLGGWIEKESNLSRDGRAWVADEAMVLGNAIVSEEAVVCNKARVDGNAIIKGHAAVNGCAEVFGNSTISGHAVICNGAHIGERATVLDNASVHDNAYVGGKATVGGHTTICHRADISGHAEILDNARVSGNAHVSGNSTISGNAKVLGSAYILDNAIVDEQATVSGYAIVRDNAHVSGDTAVCGNARVLDNAMVRECSDVFVVGKIGSRNDFTTFYRDKDNEIMVACGCFNGKLERFLEKVTETHGWSKTARVYRSVAEAAQLQMGIETDWKEFNLASARNIICHDSKPIANLLLNMYYGNSVESRCSFCEAVGMNKKCRSGSCTDCIDNLLREYYTGDRPVDFEDWIHNGMKCKYYVTFGYDEYSPYEDTYIIVLAKTKEEAIEKVRNRYADKCSFDEIYSETEWRDDECKKLYTDDPEEIIE